MQFSLLLHSRGLFRSDSRRLCGDRPSWALILHNLCRLAQLLQFLGKFNCGFLELFLFLVVKIVILIHIIIVVILG